MRGTPEPTGRRRRADGDLSLFQLHLPIRAAEELLPALAPDARLDARQRPPRGLPRRAPQRHPRLRWGAVRLPLVAGDARERAILPARHAAAAPRRHVVDRQLLRPRLRAAVLAREAVALEEVPARENDRPLAQALVVREEDHLGRRDLEPRRPDPRVAEPRLRARDVVPRLEVVRRERFRLDDP